VIDRCKAEEPPFVDYGSGHFAACWRARESIELMPGQGLDAIVPTASPPAPSAAQA
jgi:hypothetical protein